MRVLTKTEDNEEKSKTPSNYDDQEGPESEQKESNTLPRHISLRHHRSENAEAEKT